MIEPHALDCMRNNNAVCPYCGYEQSDTWELFGDKGDAFICVLSCDKCGEEFEVTQNIDISYTTKKKEEDNEPERITD